jgi:hypothetical protein
VEFRNVFLGSIVAARIVLGSIVAARIVLDSIVAARIVAVVSSFTRQLLSKEVNFFY